MPRSASHYARFIPSEEIDAQSVQQWKFGNVELEQPGAPVPHSLPELAVLQDLLPPPAPAAVVPELPPVPEEDAAALEAQRAAEWEAALQSAREQARAEGYAEGLTAGQSEGLAQGRQDADAEWAQKFSAYQTGQGQEVAQQLNQLLQSAQAQVQGMQARMAPDLLQLACDIARQVVRQELRTNPQALMPVVSEALDMLSAESKPATVRLNPKDWAQLEQHLKAAHPQPKIEWLADASVQPGNCLVESAGAQVDGSLERRWQRAVAALGLVSTWYDGAPAHAA